ncbi:MAG: indole-3-glycerol phosphate synthase TrpC [Deltaproteobacteria bacterium]|nr:indole-3-glycerol phosphate synthase TrpC [Deltaproteobacteria bacterium]
MDKPDFLETILVEKMRQVEESRLRTCEEALWEKALLVGRKRDFFGALSEPGSRDACIIAEIKRASPSKGPLCPDLDPAALARAYEKGGASCISVLTDAPFFKALEGDLGSARQSSTLPVLRKDFIVSTYQVFETVVMGADAILLIVAALDDAFLAEAIKLAKEFKMTALVEVHEECELERALKAGAELVGINNRNLKTFVTDIGTTERLSKLLPQDKKAVCESGIKSREDILRIMDSGVCNFLIGETLVKSPDPTAMLRNLKGMAS